MIKGRVPKRLLIDLSNHRVSSEEIASSEIERWIGGRGLNARFFLEENPPNQPFSPQNPVAFAVGPVTGTLIPFSGFTSVSTFSPLLDPPGYAHLSLPGHFGAELKQIGFEQLIIRGKGEKPIYLWIDEKGVIFEDATHIWGKDTYEASIKIYEEKDDRDAEIICIGPAGERLIPFSNVTNCFSWTGEHIGLGSIFGSKNLKAVAIRGGDSISTDKPSQFLNFCLSLRERIQNDRKAIQLREEGTFFSLGENGGGLGIRNFNEMSNEDTEKRWKKVYLKKYHYGRQGCFSCPIHCGRITQFLGEYFGGLHLEGAWSLGPRIGIYDWQWTLKLFRTLQLNGIDPASMGSLLSWMVDCHEKGIFSDKEIGSNGGDIRDGETIAHMMDMIISGRDMGEIFCRGSLYASKILGKGHELVHHTKGMELPIRDPRSSNSYSLSLKLFPSEWDYLVSFDFSEHLSKEEDIVSHVTSKEKLKILADTITLCPLVVSRLSLIKPEDISEILEMAIGISKIPSQWISVADDILKLEKNISGE